MFYFKSYETGKIKTKIDMFYPIYTILLFSTAFLTEDFLKVHFLQANLQKNNKKAQMVLPKCRLLISVYTKPKYNRQRCFDPTHSRTYSSLSLSNEEIHTAQPINNIKARQSLKEQLRYNSSVHISPCWLSSTQDFTSTNFHSERSEAG